MKELNYRLTATEKFWSDECGKAVLQQRANDPSDQRPTDNIQATATSDSLRHPLLYNSSKNKPPDANSQKPSRTLSDLRRHLRR